MAWRPTLYLIEGILDNTVQGKVRGWMRFSGLSDKVVFDLEGNFHRDIRGARIRLCGEGETANVQRATAYMQDFSLQQKGKTGDITAGLEPRDYVDYPYFEWYSEDNGRCVIELESDQIELLSLPIPALESDPISRKEQAENMANFLGSVAEVVGIPLEHTISTGNTMAVERAKKVCTNDRIRGMKLLPKELRETLPALYSQDGKGGKAVVHLKYFTPDSNWTWYITEGEPVLDEKGRELDFRFFGLVEGHDRELGYVSLSELEETRGPLGLPIERDLHFRPKTLAEIAPDLFSEEQP